MSEYTEIIRDLVSIGIEYEPDDWDEYMNKIYKECLEYNVTLEGFKFMKNNDCNMRIKEEYEKVRDFYEFVVKELSDYWEYEKVKKIEKRIEQLVDKFIDSNKEKSKKIINRAISICFENKILPHMVKNFLEYSTHFYFGEGSPLPESQISINSKIRKFYGEIICGLREEYEIEL